MSEENNTALGENADVESEQSKSYKTYDGAPRLDELDRKILKLITGNARIAFLEVARMCGVSGAAIHQRVQRLMNIGVIKG
ncbi:MAG: AsnC family transcriptional regulator, partial [Bacteroidales bacterium]|nr:AsnC family transcriptional regulator [Bacteroidales bacterium]